MSLARRLTLLLLLSTSITMSLMAQVTLSGSAPSYAGQELIFYQYADYITQTEQEVARCVVDNEGRFKCYLKLNETSYIFSHLGVYRLYLFVEPGRSYELSFPDYEPKTEPQRLNPFFREADLHAGIIGADRSDINYLISSFDLSFNEHFDEIVKDAYSGKKTLPLDSLTTILEERFAPFNHPFFNSYRTYRYGLLSQLALMQQSRGISRAYFEKKPILYNNPSYMELFNLVFDKYFLFFARSEAGGAALNQVTNQRSFSQLKQTLANDRMLASDTLLELVILKGLHDGFFDDNFSRSALLAILDSVLTTSANDEHLLIAQNIRSKVTRLLPGFVPSPFELYTPSGELLSMDKFRGKYVYLNFCSTTSYTCIQEFSLLDKLYQKHKERLEIVTISVDNDINDLKLFLDQTKYQWTFLHYGNKPEIIRDFDIRAYPTYFLIGPDRRLVMSPAPTPKENFEIQFFQALRSRGEI